MFESYADDAPAPGLLRGGAANGLMTAPVGPANLVHVVFIGAVKAADAADGAEVQDEPAIPGAQVSRFTATPHGGRTRSGAALGGKVELDGTAEPDGAIVLDIRSEFDGVIELDGRM